MPGTANWTADEDAFTSVQLSGYWSSTSSGSPGTNFPIHALFVDITNGVVNVGFKVTDMNHVLPVRGA